MIDQLAKQLADEISKTFERTQDFRDASASQLRAIIDSALKKMQLVTREEFDAQTAVLHRTLRILEALEEKVQKLEKDHADNG